MIYKIEANKIPGAVVIPVYSCFIMKKALNILVLLLLAISSRAGTAWQLKKETEGIRIFTRKEDSSNYRSVKVECTIQCSTAALVSVLLDIGRNQEWVYHVKSAHLLKKFSDHELVYYSEFITPWPFTNRDLISHLKAEQTSAGALTIESHGEPNYLPVKKGIVRIPFSHSTWTITPVTTTSQKLEYIIQFDPGGAIPAWLTNMFLTDGPSETFKRLKERVRLPEYQNAHLSFLHD
jgi:hypothetical protein